MPAAPSRPFAPAPLDYQINPNRIVVIGFSAGGHLAALAGTQFVPGNPNAEDPIDRASSRPDYLVLGYPWLGAITTDTSHLSYCKIFNLMDQCDALRAKYDPVLFVTKDTPPTFIYHTFNDQTVPVEQSLDFYEALVKAGVPSEYHVFANGAHGSGLGKGDPALDQWPNLLENWLRAQGLLTVDKAPSAPSRELRLTANRTNFAPKIKKRASGFGSGRISRNRLPAGPWTGSRW